MYTNHWYDIRNHWHIIFNIIPPLPLNCDCLHYLVKNVQKDNITHNSFVA